MSFNPSQISMAHDLARSRGFLCVEDVDLIQRAVRMLPTERAVQVVDLGAGSGTTALSVFCARSGNIAVLTVDHDPVAIASTEECMTNAGYWHLWVGVQGDSATLAQGFRFVDGIDLLMVDASHEYADVVADLAAWLPNVRSGGLCWLHDMTALYPGVVRAVGEAIAEGKLIPIATEGWGILCRTPNEAEAGIEAVAS